MDKFVQRSPKPLPKPTTEVTPCNDKEDSIQFIGDDQPAVVEEPAPKLTPMKNSTNSPRRESPVKTMVEADEKPVTPTVRKRPPHDSVASTSDGSEDTTTTPDIGRTRNHGKRPRLETPVEKRVLLEQKREEARLLREQQKRERDEEKQRAKEAAQKEREEKKRIETAEREEKKRVEAAEREEKKRIEAAEREEKKRVEAAEKEEKRKAEAAERERVRLEKEEQKEKARIERENEREQQRINREAEKENARLAKEAEKEKARLEKAEALAKEEAAKLAKIQGSVNIMANFVSKALPATPTTPKVSNPESRFGVFEVKEGVLMAPSTRRTLTSEEKSTLDQFMLTEGDTDRTYVSLLRAKEHTPRTDVRTKDVVSDKDIIHVANQVDDDIVKSYTHRTKYLHFHQNYRPPYYGTWRKRSSRVTGRRPFAKDTTDAIDYDVDSDDEWDDEPEDAETLSDNEAQSGDEEDLDDDDGFEVEHGYLSDGEGEDDADVCTDPEERRLRMAAKAEAWRLEHDPSKLLRLPLSYSGPWYPDADGKYEGREACLVDKLNECKVFVIGQPMTTYNWESHAERIEGPPVVEEVPEEVPPTPEVETTKRTPKSKSIKAMFVAANKTPNGTVPNKEKKRIQLQPANLPCSSGSVLPTVPSLPPATVTLE